MKLTNGLIDSLPFSPNEDDRAGCFGTDISFNCSHCDICQQQGFNQNISFVNK